MRSFAKQTTLLFLTACLLLILAGAAFAQSGAGQIRFVHVLPGAGGVDIYINDAPTVRQLNFGEATTHIEAPAGSHRITTTLAGTRTPLWEQDFTVAPGQSYTLVVSTTEPLTWSAFTDDLNPLSLGQTRITAIHAIADAPAVDIVLADGRAVVAGLSYNQPYGTLDIPALTYELGIVPSGAGLDNAVLEPQAFSLDGGTLNTIVAFGTLNSPQTLVLRAATNANSGDGYVRFVHGVPGGPAVDMLVNDAPVATSLGVGIGTEFIALPTGEHTVSLRASGVNEIVASTSITVAEGARQTVVALLDGQEITLTAFDDDIAAIDLTTPVLAVINGIPGAGSVSIETGTTSQPVASGELVAVPVIDNTASVMVDGSDAPLPFATLYGGVYYTSVVVAGETASEAFFLAPVSLAQTVGSAPGDALNASPQIVQASAVTPTSEPQVVEPIAATPEPQVVEAQPTAAPAVLPTAQVGPTARIVLDPGANLQLRQYPSRDALSLGLAPSGTVLLVIGRQGAPFFPDFLPSPTPAPEATEYVDPATLLEDGADLIPGDTWLNVDYVTPDGGTINAWVNAQFLDVRDNRGRRQRLADLPTVPENQPGEARNTAVTPPPLPQDVITATVVGMDAGVNLQIRRTPTTSGESLALVPNDTVLELLGVLESREWAFVRYVQPQGGTVRGWASTRFLTYQFNGRSTDLDRLEELERLVILPDTQRGDLTSGAAVPIAPTVNPLRNVVVATIILNEGANLHLRRTPNPNAESLALMPNGTQVIVSGRSEDAAWVQVEFEGQTGWAASQYMRFTFNEAPVELQTVTVIFTGATATPTAAPGT